MKGGTDPPLKPDEEYPEWLWELADPQPTLFELRRKYEAAGKDISKMEMREVGALAMVRWTQGFLRFQSHDEGNDSMKECLLSCDS